MTATSSLHLAIIPDGNRRWAKQHMLKPWEGHRRALDNTRALVTWCRESPRVKVLTLWGFSTENWNRDNSEISKLMSLITEYLKSERSTFEKNKTRFVHSGRTDRIPDTLSALINDIEQQTLRYDDLIFHLALDYGGKDEMVRAIQRLPQGKVVSEESIQGQLDNPDLPQIDLIIRTSGERRLSNFFMWQAAHAELYFTNTLYPDLKPNDLATAIADFESRRRRFGS